VLRPRVTMCMQTRHVLCGGHVGVHLGVKCVFHYVLCSRPAFTFRGLINWGVRYHGNSDSCILRVSSFVIEDSGGHRRVDRLVANARFLSVGDDCVVARS
jgi:hypothetical protein